jgi:hypothetical protein
MIQKKSRVRIKSNYSGGLDKVIGETAKVIDIEVTAPEIENRYVLDIEGERTHNYTSGGRQVEYKHSYPVIVNQGEVDEVPYDFKDCEGNIVELGDTVVYSSYGGGITKGTVVDFKDMVYPRWGDAYPELKMQIEYDSTGHYSDGGGENARHIKNSVKRRKWVSNSSQTLIIEKDSVKKFLQSNKREIYGV